MNVIRFPRPFRRQPEQPPKPHPIRDAAKRRMRALIALAVEVFDLLDGPEPPDEATPPRRFRRRRKAPQQDGTAQHPKGTCSKSSGGY